MSGQHVDDACESDGDVLLRESKLMANTTNTNTINTNTIDTNEINTNTIDTNTIDTNTKI